MVHYNVANVLFLESPLGLGFSHSNTTSDYDHAGDKSIAKNAYVFLINWLKGFPQYKTSDFYTTGESYAGHYVPQLAYTILLNNKFSPQNINLKGIVVCSNITAADIIYGITYHLPSFSNFLICTANFRLGMLGLMMLKV